MTEKICGICKKSLLLENFRVNKNTGQLNKICISCLEKYKCQHERQKTTCRDWKGLSICEHNKIRSTCKECKGGHICQHDRRRSTCKDCGGSSICKHKKERRRCPICDPAGHLANIVRSRVKQALKSNKKMSSMECLACDIKTFKAHIEAQFKEGMSWENHGEWHIDHKIPLKYKENGETPSLEEVCVCVCVYNTQKT